jgi:hypothetical protein
MGIVVEMGGMRLRGGLRVEGAIRNIVHLSLPAGKVDLVHLGFPGLIIEPKWLLEGSGGLGVVIVTLIHISSLGGIRGIVRRMGILNMARLRGILNMARLWGLLSMACLRGILNMAHLRGIPNMARLRGILNMVRLSPLGGIGGPNMMEAIGMDRGYVLQRWRRSGNHEASR